MLMARWLRKYYERVDVEPKFIIDGQILFVPDIACYGDGLECIYEITHRHGLDANKLARIQHYQYVNGFDFKVREVEAETVLAQVNKPKYIKHFDFTTYMRTYQPLEHEPF
jgi:hypothetical protein